MDGEAVEAEIVGPKACTTYRGDMSQRVPLGSMPRCKPCGGAFDEHENPWGKPQACRPCPLFRAPGPVSATGPLDARLAFFGEAPGAQEVDEEMGFRRERFSTFVGGSGRTLTAMCAQAGIFRKETYCDNVVKCRPPSNRKPTELEVALCGRAFLIPTLDKISPNVVVPLGDTALGVLSGLKGITNHRGVAIEGYTKPDGSKQKLLPSWHPAFILRSQHLWPFAVHDLARAAAESEFPELRRVPFDIITGASSEASRRDLLSACRERGGATFDFETTGLSPKRDQIVMVGITPDGRKADVLDWSGPTAELLQAVFDDPEIKIIGQNILYFDLPFAEGKGMNIDKAWGKVVDDMVLFHLCNASYGNTPAKGAGKARGPEKDLTMIASCHTDIPYWKSRDNYKNDLRRVCGIDVIATHRAAMDPETGLLAELKANGMEALYWKHVLPVHPVLHKMTKRGVRCDVPKAMRWAVRFRRYAAEMQQTLRDALNEPWLNVNSSKDLISLLYDKMKLPVQWSKDIKTGELRRTADAFALENLSDLAPENFVLKCVTESRHAQKMDSTYIAPGVADGRYRPHFGTSKTSNGRLNSWDPNGQNIPDEFRELWLADSEDEVLIASDWSQIEWRVAMVLSADPVGLDLLARGVDTHSAVCAEVFEKRIEDVSPHERHAAKFIVYGLAYGRTVQSIADAMSGQGGAARTVGGSARAHALRTQKVEHGGLTTEFVENFVSRFKTRFAAYWRYRQERVDFAAKHNYLENAWGRRRWWYTREVNEQYSFDPSSTAAEMMIDSLITLDSQLPKGATLRLSVHDEIVINTPKSIAREAWKCLRDVMQSTWPRIEDYSSDRAVLRKFYPNGWHCPADIHVGPNWAICKSKEAHHIAVRAALEKNLGLEDLH